MWIRLSLFKYNRPWIVDSVWLFFFLSSNCPFFLIFSFSSNKKHLQKNTLTIKDQRELECHWFLQCKLGLWHDAQRKDIRNGASCCSILWDGPLWKRKRHYYPHQCTWADVFSVWSTRWCQKEWGRPTALSAFLLQYTWYVEGAWTTDLSGVFSSACNWVISSVLSPLRKGFVDLFVLATALVSTSESSISWIPRSPRRKPSNTNGSSSHFRTGVGRELPLALKISLSNNFHIKCISYPSLLLPELAKPVFNPDSFKMFRFFHPALIVCLISSAAWFRLSVQSKHTS